MARNPNNPIFLLLFYAMSVSFTTISALSSDGQALISLLSKWAAPKSVNISWDASKITPCSWVGVQCDNTYNVVSLNLSNFGISGPLGPEIGQLGHLQSIDISFNSISGPIPTEISNCSLIQHLDLSANKLTGEIPQNLGNLQNLQHLSFFENSLMGQIPKSLFHIPKLLYVVLSRNKLSGSIPSNIGNATKLVCFWVNDNQLSGSIPSSIGNCSALKELYLNDNHLVGVLPESLNVLKSLVGLDVSSNSLEGTIPLGSSSCENVQKIDLSWNHFNGVIPQGLGNCSNMIAFAANSNHLTGSIPSSFGLLTKLSVLNLAENSLSGEIPSELGNCKSLTELLLGDNKLEGELPMEMMELGNLKNLSLHGNQFSGIIPQGLGINSSLVHIKLRNNSFSGEIPPHLCFGKRLLVLDLGHNMLSGSIPHEIGSCTSLKRLILEHNNLTGVLPEFAEDHSLLYMDLSRNNIHGKVPSSLDNCRNLKLLDVSYNNLTGSLAAFDNLPALDYVTRSALSNRTGHKTRWSHLKGELRATPIAIIVFVTSVSTALAALSVCYIVIRCRRRLKQEVEISGGRKQDGSSSFPFNEIMEATRNLDETYIIGRGAHGTVYKASMGPNKVHAVKKLVFSGQRSGADVSMVREIQTLGKIRHRNLVKLKDFWLTKDYGLIMYEYMENGSLCDVLRRRRPLSMFRWDVRYKIALGTAHGLAYLHFDCRPPILHRDIKPENILLDSEMVPHISDFGIAKLLDESSPSTMSFAVQGTIGYIAPENAFATTRSKESDVYSYGVVLLELLTRKKAVDASYPEGMDLVGWIQSSWNSSQQIDKVIDGALLEEFHDSKVVDQVFDVFFIALRCTESDPKRRLTMRDVVKQLEDASSSSRL